MTKVFLMGCETATQARQLQPDALAVEKVGGGFMAIIASKPKFSRAFSMPNRATFSMAPVAEFVARYAKDRSRTIDPFARNNAVFAGWTNDLDPASNAAIHMDAEAACKHWHNDVGVVADCALFDPPYSPRQISEVYKSIGLKVGMEETQNARLYKRVRDAIDPMMNVGGHVLSFGWSTNGMGIGRGYELVEVLLVAHGGAHNDTICIAEKKIGKALPDPELF